MERLNNIHESELTPETFARFSIWTWDDEQEGYHPVSGTGSLPSDYPTFFIRAKFTASCGRRLAGYLIGRDSFWGFGLFIGEKEYLVNFNLPNLARPVLSSLSDEVKGDVFPLSYIAELPGCESITGVFQRSNLLGEDAGNWGSP